MPSYFTKDPQAYLDYTCTWGDWLNSCVPRDTIAASTWIVPPDLTVGNQTFTNTLATVWLSGGVAGASYTIVNKVTTTAGRIDERSMVITVEAR